MELELQVLMTDRMTTITNHKLGKIVIVDKIEVGVLKNTVVVSFIKGKVTKIGTTAAENTDLIVLINPTAIEAIHVSEQLSRIVEEAGIKIADGNNQRIKLPTNFAKEVTSYVTAVLEVLKRFGINIIPTKTKPMKQQHRWNKAVSTVEFYVNDFGSTATIIWQKRNEMVIKKGATLVATAPLNKDGSIGLNQRVGEKLRDEQKNKLEGLVTKEDITLKSVNEVSLFLYFAGTNSWLVFKDQNGKSIDKYTIVK